MIQAFPKAQNLLLFLVVSVASAVFCPIPPASAADTLAPAQNRTLTFGVVPQFEQRRLFRVWRPILDELEKKTGLKFLLAGTPKIPAFEKRFMRGEFDVAYMNPYHIARAYSSQGYIPIVRDGGSKLSGIIVVQKNGKIQNVQQLKGREMAFPSPNALGASLLVRSDLRKKYGVTVKPRYVQTHSSVYLHVAKGLFDAGGGVQRTLDAQSAQVRNALKVIYETEGVAPHPVAVHPRVSKYDREKISQGFFEMFKSEEGRKLLSSIPITRLVETSMSDYRSIDLEGVKDLASDSP